MRYMIKKAVLAAAFVTLAPAVPSLWGDAAEAHGRKYSRERVYLGSQVAVFGVSFGNPFFVGHVHRSPVQCAAGPLYYYPKHRVYGHFHPRFEYHLYSHPVYFDPHGEGHGYARPVYGREHRHHDCRHRHHDHDDDDDYDDYNDDDD